MAAATVSEPVNEKTSAEAEQPKLRKWATKRGDSVMLNPARTDYKTFVKQHGEERKLSGLDDGMSSEDGDFSDEIRRE